MKGNPQVIEALNRAVDGRIDGDQSVFLPGQDVQELGLLKLAAKHYHESMGEMRHAEKLIDRILFLEGSPEIARYDVIRVGTDVKEQFENDLQLEMRGVKHYNEPIELCTKLKDNGSREVGRADPRRIGRARRLAGNAVGLIEAVGLQNYLTEQMGEATKSEGSVLSRQRQDKNSLVLPLAA